MHDMMPWLFSKCNEFEMIHQQEKTALEVKLAASLEREEENKSDMQNVKERLEETEDFMRKIKAENKFGETGMPDAKKRRGEATASDTDKSQPTSEANVVVSIDADGDTNMRSEQV